MNMNTDESPTAVMSTLAYVLLSRDKWPVYVSTANNYGPVPVPTEPGDTIHASAFFRPVDDYCPLVHGHWDRFAWYVDYQERATGPNDEFFLLIDTGPNGANLAAYGDYVGSDVQESNYRSLMRDYPDTFVEVSYAHDGYGLAIPLFVPVDHRTYELHQYDSPHYDRERAEELADALTRLAYEYALYDEDDHSALTSEQEYEAVRSRDDIPADLARIVVAELTTEEGQEYWEAVERVETWLADVDDLRDQYTSMGYHTVYSLYCHLAGENCRLVHEGAGVSGVYLSEHEATLLEMAELVTDRAAHLVRQS